MDPEEGPEELTVIGRVEAESMDKDTMEERADGAMEVAEEEVPGQQARPRPLIMEETEEEVYFSVTCFQITPVIWKTALVLGGEAVVVLDTEAGMEGEFIVAIYYLEEAQGGAETGDFLDHPTDDTRSRTEEEEEEEVSAGITDRGEVRAVWLSSDTFTIREHDLHDLQPQKIKTNQVFNNFSVNAIYSFIFVSHDNNMHSRRT